MKKQQKWSGVKLSKKELDEIKKEQKFEIIADIIALILFIGLIVFFIFCIGIVKAVFI